MKNEILAVMISTITVIAVFWLARQRQPLIVAILNWFPAILFAYVIPAAFTHIFSLNLSGVYIHNMSRDWIIPFTILTVMSALSFGQLRIVGVKPILVFVWGSFFISVLPVALVWLFGLLDNGIYKLFIEEEYWKGLVPIVGGWIGGSTSQLVLKEIIGTEEGLFLSILVLDNILVNIWTILMFQFIKRSNNVNAFFNIRSEIRLIEPVPNKTIKWGIGKTVTLILVITIIFNMGLESFLWKVIILSIIGLLMGNAIKGWNASLVLKIGGVCIVVIMAVLGLKLNFSNVALPSSLVLIAVTWLLLHFLAMISMAVVLRINIAWVAIGSMANLGGISTAPAVTSAYNKDLMPHAILLAILSMVSGTAWGMLTIYLFQNFWR